MRIFFSHVIGLLFFAPPILTDGDVRLEQNEILGPEFSSTNLRQDSGQTIRLRRSVSKTVIGEGRIEVFYGGSWGLVCHDFFDLTGASVACKQLGFSRGAIAAKGSSAYGSSDLRVYNVDDLVCTGSETSIFQCRRSTQSNCNLATDNAGVKCKLNYPSRCDTGGILLDKKCYYIYRDSARTFAEADTFCRSSGGSLLIVESQEENDFISEALFALYGNAQPYSYWYIGGKKDDRNKWKWQTATALTQSLFSKWMPGASAGDRNCLILRNYPDSPVTKDYFFWDAISCTAKLPFICQRPPRDVGCLQENGRDYQGAAYVSAKGLPCWKWNDPRVLAAGAIFPDQATWDHNSCRNPDDDTKPWCVVNTKSYDYCDIPDCSDVQSDNTVQLCDSDQIRCGDLPTCVSKDFICDYEQDCPNGFDERNCPDWLSVYDKLPGQKLMSRAAETWTYIPHPQGCARRCTESKTFQCRSFNYVAKEKSCLLGSQSRANGAVVAANGDSDFYELKSAATTAAPIVVCNENEFTCTNRRCVPSSGVCDGVDTCGDNSDEINCNRADSCATNLFRCQAGLCVDPSWVCDGDDDCGDGSDEVATLCQSPIEVRLVNGTNRYSGRIEIKYYGIWGTVCSDHFTNDDGRVVCKMLGRDVSPTVFTAGYFGPGNGLIWVSDVTCTGKENSLKDCKIKKWGYSQCTHAEDAGISCPDPTIPTTTVASVSSGTCGRRFVEASPRDPRTPLRARVVGGFETTPGAFPWTAAIRIKPDRHHCGATIIGEFHLLSAAHCFEEDRDNSMYQIVIGNWDNRAFDGSEQIFDVDQTFIHPNYQNVLKDDIAVVKLKPRTNGRGVQFTNFAQPACLPQRDTPYREGEKCIISGWGTMGLQYPNRLQAALIPILSRAQCSHPEIYDKLLSPNAFCAGYLSGGIDSCQGDSGGPFACLSNGKYTVLGVISWGDGCAEKNKPGVYTKVSDYLDWIKQQMTS